MKSRLAILIFPPLAGSAADTNALAPLAPAYGELPPTFWEQHQSAVSIAALATLAIAFCLWKVLRRPANPKVMPPEEVARQALAGLQSRPEDGQVLSEISKILRHYLREAFDLPKGELTTAEFYPALASCRKIDGALGEALASFLRECDVRKFSPAISAAPLNAASRAGEFIALAEKRRSAQCAATQPPQ